MDKRTLAQAPHEDVGCRYPQESASRQEGCSSDPFSQSAYAPPLPAGTCGGPSRKACSVQDSHTVAFLSRFW